MGVIDRLRGGTDDRVAVIGLDGVPFSLLSNHPDRFDNLGALLDDGSGAAMDSVLPPESSTTWPSLTTGKNPGETGVYGLVDREVNSYGTYVTSGGDVQAPRFWDVATEADRAATVLNVPLTHPPQRNLQRMVAGFLAPDLERATYPRELTGTLESLGYRLDVDATLARSGDLEGFLEDAFATLDARFTAFSHFIGLDDWDLFVGVFMTPDRVNHFLYGDYLDGGEHREDFLAFYEQLDTYLGAIRSTLPSDVTLMVVSDHGFSRLKYEVQVNQWLRDRGWLTYDAEPPADLADIGPGTRAYSLAPGRIYLNLEGREPEGGVPDAEYQVVREELREDLLAWSDPRGQPVAAEVVPRESIYRGPHVDLAPDLVVVPTEGFDLKAAFEPPGDVFRETVRTGMHRPEDAAFVVDRPGASLREASIYDVAPTALTALDVGYARAAFDGATVV